MGEGHTNIWELYGLKTNPFFTDPLLIYGGEVDLKAGFVGREDDVTRLQKLIGNDGGSRVIVSGDVGVGKTTFVNYVRALAPQTKFFTHLKEIAVQPEWTGIDFILNTLSAIYYALRTKSDINEKMLSAETLKKLELLVDIVERRDRSISLNIAGTGVGSSTSTTINIPSLTIHSLQNFFEEIVNEIRILGFSELILHYNNLEILGAIKIDRLFQSIRDFIQTKNVNFIFIGDLSVPNVISQIKRVGSIMSETPIVLENMSVTQVKQLLEKRIRYLTIPGLTKQKLYDDLVISKLYTLYQGNLRFILNSLSTAFRELINDNPLTIGCDELIKVLSGTAKKRWLDKLTEKEKEVLFFILDKGETTNKEISKKLKTKKQNISKITNRLLNTVAIRIKRIDGKEKFFSVEHSIRWFLLEKKSRGKDIEKQDLVKEVQTILGDY